MPFNRSTDTSKSLFDELADRVPFAGCQHIIVGLGLLHHHPHAFDIIARMAPVADRIQVAQIKPILQSEFDRRGRARDLAGHKGFATRWTFMIE